MYPPPSSPALESRKGCKQTATKRDGGNGTSVPAPLLPHRGDVVWTVSAEGDKQGSRLFVLSDNRSSAPPLTEEQNLLRL